MDSISPRYAEALRRRETMNLSEGGDTDAYRLVDGLGDALPGIELETFGDAWLVSTRDAFVPRDMAAWLQASGRPIYHKRLDQHQKESPVHLAGAQVNAPFLIKENGLAYEISFQAGYSQGIFLDQRCNRLALRQRLGRGKSLLNTFAYTGAFSVAAASVGAVTTTLDLSQPYLDWAKRNLEHNGLDPASHHFCKGDTFHWLARFAKQGRQFDAIVLDPPTFSRDKDGKVFRVERDYGRLASLAAQCLSPHGVLLASTNCRQLTDATFLRTLREAIPRGRHFSSVPMPPDFTGEAYLKSVWVEM
ncbi:23S rRNA (cytosine1962-C5)-methyltransferase [Haloferula luteola]|uniref:23S rRNA (Cytosine1962-C5)-methyltransferase n=1 Tax=Haloferula luteola TaxID=595692 RepID=A0A840V4J7_9BACT|nr:class I SAM-dependent methyltransferase [Haloferula luteola]MBB5350564.1 23S rRNA (cytosine1962-C5)-methyltransferase [Haloferula luteola]